MTRTTALCAVTATVIASAAAGACSWFHRTPKQPAPATIDAGVAPAPDAEAPPPPIPDAAPPATMTFAPSPWPVGQKVRVWRRVRLADVPGSDPISSEWELPLSVTASDSAATVAIGDDCQAVIGGGGARVTGDCGGTGADILYKLDTVAQLLAIAHGTVTVGDAAPGLARPLVALFHLQDAGAIVTARVVEAGASGATYAVHVELDGLLLRSGLHLTGVADGELTIDAQGRTISGALRAPRVTIEGYPMAGYPSTGSLELSLSIAPP